MTVTAGVDIGSTTSKAAVVVDGEAVAQVVSASSTNPSRTAAEVYEQALSEAGLSSREVAFVVGTGYGRTQVPFADKNVSEITCHARGAHHVLAAARTVIDVGGQDTKVIRLDSSGNLLDFVMNSKCAAGTGRFLEAMARSMDITLVEMEEHYFGPGDPCRISNMCSVFAESEVINLINDGVELPRIVKGLLRSLANRVNSLATRIGVEQELVMTGGVAKSRAVRDAIESKLGSSIRALDDQDPQLVGALGAALIAADLAATEGEGGA
ncbi:MAG: 2-hydroxyglutaryl-CoA dehydratase [Deltaproteobacteria bacterium]|jgi:predicted CoA-substrate-specific enzyme activase|nr:2-hydroxyglutaryl-CoA dehydratase [Deltaproteobacteria bacterium]MBW2531526.1 2-hydroxyglutaryl-CoA dehydratase [Deltaproteobacteria bacterium]